MVNIGGQVWQDEEAYIAFMASNNKNAVPSVSKIELLERDLERLVKAIKDRESYFEMTLRAGNDVLIKPGESILVPTGITTAIMEDYTQTIEIINTLNSNSWLRVAPFLVSKIGLSYLDLKNFAQMVLAQELHSCILRRSLENTRLYIQNVADINTTTVLHHVAYDIKTGDELAILRIRKK